MKTVLSLIMALSAIFFDASGIRKTFAGDTLWVNYTAFQCDSLVQANATNPDFCVMDVRTWSEYAPDHIEGAINRDYYSSDFHDLIDALPRNKMYMIHCAGGSRSINVFNMMKTMGFLQLVNMLGGLYAWENAFYPTTSDFAPLQMAVSDTTLPIDSIPVGTTETIHLTVTNRANDTLRFTGITSLMGTEFSTDFDTSTTLEGPFDYNFSIFYTPLDEQADSVTFLIPSNGGDVRFHIMRTGKINLSVQNGLHDAPLIIYPNPCSLSATINFEMPAPGIAEFIIFNNSGQIVDKIVQENALKGKNRILWDTKEIPSGLYFSRLKTTNRDSSGKVVKIQIAK
jgi:rhodanese-related sulfurtransferase